MRVRYADNSSTAEEMREFSDFLLQVGEGRHEGHPVLGKEYMKLPGDMVIPNPVEDPDEDEEIVPGAIPKGMTRLIGHMYADVNNPEIATDEYFANWTILTKTTQWFVKLMQLLRIAYWTQLANTCPRTLWKMM
ncbi:Helitron helicase [Phytophthora megakarya]|uniref:Helitron helicase n=1 Tax=Phytophthora megakarya TaxID=4795 RepID=A0A225VHM8_9STRA|nr:Helitron helicase [Phytophthora megakarya]